MHTLRFFHHIFFCRAPIAAETKAKRCRIYYAACKTLPGTIKCLHTEYFHYIFYLGFLTRTVCTLNKHYLACLNFDRYPLKNIKPLRLSRVAQSVVAIMFP